MSFKPNNQLYFIKRVLYNLKTNYGSPMEIYQILQSDYDQKTGKRTQQRRRIEIPLAVILPNVLSKKFSYDLAYIAANKNFTYGANYELGIRNVIIDAEYVPEGVTITPEDYAVIEDKRYEIKTAEALEHDYGYLLSLKATTGALAQSIIDLRVSNQFHLDSEVLNTP
jgi:hypothetical protein